jgi:hypothetical protein
MKNIRIIDTFDDFSACWSKVAKASTDRRIDAWAEDYLSRWPELLAKQIENYASEKMDWRRIARERVFPHLARRLPGMRRARRNLQALCGPVCRTVRRTFGFDHDVLFVIHVGIGCGAGWATTFQDTPSVLFGLESIAECGWTGRGALTGLIAHELAHLGHHHRRMQNGKPTGSGPWWQLYEEGFAQRCERKVLGSAPWRQANSRGGRGWLGWCRSRRDYLAAEFIHRADTGGDIRPFFGSWFDLDGKRETGYFLGCEAIRELETRHSLEEIALWENVEEHLRPVLAGMAQTQNA